MRRRWFINKTNPEFVDYLAKAASISPILSRLLIHRGITSVSAVKEFLSPGITGLSDPFILTGMRAAIQRILIAVANNEKVLVHGDYDTDGVTATAIMVTVLRALGLEADYFIPNRVIHGYGFNPAAVDIAKKKGAKLIITVDCGITSFEAAACAKGAGIDLIITDHHEPLRKEERGSVGAEVGAYNNTTLQKQMDEEFILPEAVSVINPKLQIRNPELANLSGAGVAFKFAQAIALAGEFRFSPDESLLLIDLAALGTLADVVPLKGENRHLVQEGLKRLQAAERPGIRALKDVCGLNKRKLKAGLLAFTVVPRMNAAGRVADAGDVVRLLLSADYDETLQIATWLDSLNTERQRIEEEVYQQARSKLAGSETDSVIVLSSEGWHEGVLGIVASRLAEEFYRPAVVLSVENGIARGSARSIPSFDICAALTGCGELLLSCGGHKQAAGLRLMAGNIQSFKEAMIDILRNSLGAEDLLPSLEIDADIKLSDVTHSLVRELEMLEPFGYGNAEPLFGAKGLEVVYQRIVGNNHLKMRLRKDAGALDTIGFNMGRLFEDLDSPAEIDAVFVPSLNEWNGGRYLQLVLKAIRPCR